MQFRRQAILKNHQNIELHGFCDASEKAYGACIYLRSSDGNGIIHVELYCAKSRITPLEGSHTIPRLELSAAELLTTLLIKLKEATQIKPSREILWSDSTVVLQWINKSPHELERFTANRVAKIQDRTSPQAWRHVRTYDNPADALSRGQLPAEFLSNNLWTRGPDWLKDDEDSWPHLDIGECTTLPGLKKATCLLVSKTDESGQINSLLFNKFSSFNKLKRITAWCLRWRYKQFKGQGTSELRQLTLEELQAAETRILQVVQRTKFPTEYKQIKGKQNLSTKSSINNLSPFIDKDNLIRVGGRLANASHLNFNQKHPILLPKGHVVTKLMIRQTHQDNLHPRVQNTLHLIRQRYWPVDGRNQVKHVIRECVPRTKVNPPTVKYSMRNLPRARITQTNPFTYTGVDYCGPFYIKEKRHRNRNKLKAWICIVVCFATKAVHIEVASELSSEEFIAALSRFISRHPSCKFIHSDNGTNFVGANNELEKLHTWLNNEENNEHIQRTLTDKGIQWTFIPPASPHCGGIWEAAVKSCKHHLKIVIGNDLLTYQQLNTLCFKIEGILNSRPLTPLSSDPNDLAVLTPAHFLHGESTSDLPSPDWTETPINRLSYWQHLEKIKQHFWNRWDKEYLNELNIRHKWTEGQHDITIGTLVLLRDDNLPPLKWRMGRVIELYPAADGITRKVKLKTTTGITERNIKKLAPLPVDPKDNTLLGT